MGTLIDIVNSWIGRQEIPMHSLNGQMTDVCPSLQQYKTPVGGGVKYYTKFIFEPIILLVELFSSALK